MSTPDTTVGAKQLLTTTRAVRDPATRGNFGLTRRLPIPGGNGMRGRSGMAGRFLGELHARGQPQLGVDVGEVGLHGAR